MNQSYVQAALSITRLNALTWLTIWFIGTFLSIVSLLIIIASFKKLVRLEFYILVVFTLLTILYKLASITQIMIANLWSDLLSSCFYSIVNSLASVLSQKLFTTLFYYSLFQISMISREKFFLALYSRIHNSYVYLTFEISLSILFLVIGGISFYLGYQTNNKCSNINVLLQVLIDYKFLVIQVASNFLPVIAYIMSTVYLCYVRFIRNRTASLNETSQMRKNLRVMIKFLAFALIFLTSSLFQNIFFIYSFLLGGFSDTLLFIGHTGFILYAIQPIFVIYIHKILNATFRDSVFRLFSFMRN